MQRRGSGGEQAVASAARAALESIVVRVVDFGAKDPFSRLREKVARSAG
jgi:hypothetical protein